MVVTIHVVSADGRLREALRSRLGTALCSCVVAWAAAVGGAAAGDVVVAPTAELSVSDCARLARDGVRVVVLAPIPRLIEERSYSAAGARGYLPMTVDTGPLIEAVKCAAGCTPIIWPA